MSKRKKKKHKCYKMEKYGRMDFFSGYLFAIFWINEYMRSKKNELMLIDVFFYVFVMCYL